MDGRRRRGTEERSVGRSVGQVYVCFAPAEILHFSPLSLSLFLADFEIITATCLIKAAEDPLLFLSRLDQPTDRTIDQIKKKRSIDPAREKLSP